MKREYQKITYDVMEHINVVVAELTYTSGKALEKREKRPRILWQCACSNSAGKICRKCK